jgi:hypothetical protein
LQVVAVVDAMVTKAELGLAEAVAQVELFI